MDSIVGYIRQYQNTYTHAAISQQLLTAGYTPADVEAAWRIVESEALVASPFPGQPAIVPGSSFSAAPEELMPPPRHPVARTWAFWLTLLGSILLAYLLPGLLFFFVSGYVDYNSPLYTVISLSPYGVCGVLQLGALIGGIALINRHRPVGLGLLLGLLFADVVLPVVAVCILGGICIAILAGGGNVFP